VANSIKIECYHTSLYQSKAIVVITRRDLHTKISLGFGLRYILYRQASIIIHPCRIWIGIVRSSVTLEPSRTASTFQPLLPIVLIDFNNIRSTIPSRPQVARVRVVSNVTKSTTSLMKLADLWLSALTESVRQQSGRSNSHNYFLSTDLSDKWVFVEQTILAISTITTAREVLSCLVSI